MSRYTHALTCIIPAPIGPIGAHIGRALDPDTGGEHTFRPMDAEYDAEGGITKEPTKLWVCACPVVTELAETIPYLLANPEMLRDTIVRDYELRFPDVEPPSIEDVRAFCEASEVSVVGEGF